MDRKDVEKLKVEVLERRNYLKELGDPIPVTKRSLYRGIRGRLRRRADSRYFKNVEAQKVVYNKKLLDINNYLKYLDKKDLVKPLTKEIEGNGDVSIEPLVASQLSRSGMGSKPIRLRARYFPRGIKGRAMNRVRVRS